MIDDYKFDESHRAVLYGLQVIMRRDIGVSEPIAASTLFFSVADGWKEIDLADVFYLVEKHFEVRIALSTWDAIFRDGHHEAADWNQNIGKRLTFGHVAAFIAARLPMTRLAPLTILGKRCEQAGAFRTIEQLVERFDTSDAQFGPSTPIRERLRGSTLKRVWNQLTWLSEGRLPELRKSPSEWIRNWLLGKMFLAVGPCGPGKHPCGYCPGADFESNRDEAAFRVQDVSGCGGGDGAGQLINFALGVSFVHSGRRLR